MPTMSLTALRRDAVTVADGADEYFLIGKCPTAAFELAKLVEAGK
jgi:precorrin isomerase